MEGRNLRKQAKTKAKGGSQNTASEECKKF